MAWVRSLRGGARTGHSSQAILLGSLLIHKSNLVPSGSVGPPLLLVDVSGPFRGDEDK